MKLTIKDRVFIPGILPKEGGRLEMINVKALYDKIEFNAVEMGKHKIKQDKNGVITWDTDFEKDIDIGEGEAVILRDALNKMDQERRIPLEFLSTVEKLYKYLQQ